MHELIVQLRAAGLLPPRALCEMLEDRPEHRTPRRGCGLTQATRYLAPHINLPPDPLSADDLGLVGEWSAWQIRSLAERAPVSDARGWRAWLDPTSSMSAPDALKETAQRLAQLKENLNRVANQLQFAESRSLLALLEGVLLRSAKGMTDLPPLPQKPAVGSCSQAEEYFLEIAHGRVRRGGSMLLYLDSDGTPLMLEKRGLGEPKSAILLGPLSVSGVELPAGASVATELSANAAPIQRLPKGLAFPVAALAGIYFLRLTTLSVEPESRMRAFSAQVEAQIQADLLSPLTTRIDDLRGVAIQQLQRATPS
jgi:hypothetical protein